MKQMQLLVGIIGIVFSLVTPFELYGAVGNGMGDASSKFSVDPSGKQETDGQQRWIAHFADYQRQGFKTGVKVFYGNDKYKVIPVIKSDDFTSIQTRIAQAINMPVGQMVLFKGKRPTQKGQIQDLEGFMDAYFSIPGYAQIRAYSQKEVNHSRKERESLKAHKPEWQQQWIDYIAENSYHPKRDAIMVEVYKKPHNYGVDVTTQDNFSTILSSYKQLGVTPPLIRDDTGESITNLQEFSDAVMNGKKIRMSGTY